jgi:hypothetical protein
MDEIQPQTPMFRCEILQLLNHELAPRHHRRRKMIGLVTILAMISVAIG